MQSEDTQGDEPPVNQVVDTIIEMAVQLPALKEIGEELGRFGFATTGDRPEDGGSATTSDRAAAKPSR